MVAIGDEVCRTLVTSVAALSGGTLALVDKSQELPAKVGTVGVGKWGVWGWGVEGACVWK